MLLQVSRFDPWKDPLGVIEAYREVKAQHPGMQLALVGSMAHDDPEGWEYYNQTVEFAGDDPDVHILSNLNNVGAVEVNAFQVHAAACIQKSIKEGFGLTVSEALWKARPMIGGSVGGIAAQIEDGVTGYLVDSAQECAQRALEILADPAEARQMARRGKEQVRRRFLTPRLMRDWLALMHRFEGEQVELEVRGRATEARARDTRAMDEPQLLIVSNRGPMRFETLPDGSQARAKRGGGGLVTALSALTTQRPLTWVASALSDEDAEVAAEGVYEDGNLRLSWSRTTARSTTATTTSSPTRRCGSSTTTCGGWPWSRTSTATSGWPGRPATCPSTSASPRPWPPR